MYKGIKLLINNAIVYIFKVYNYVFKIKNPHLKRKYTFIIINLKKGEKIKIN